MSSPGTRTLIERYADAVRTGDLDTVETLIDDGDGVLVNGTDPEEWWKGRETVLGVPGADVRLKATDARVRERRVRGLPAGRYPVLLAGKRIGKLDVEG